MDNKRVMKMYEDIVKNAKELSEKYNITLDQALEVVKIQSIDECAEDIWGIKNNLS